jgi:hypothetical protein
MKNRLSAQALPPGDPSSNPAFSPQRSLAVVQGLYFALTGLWALVSIRTFEVVTGPKTDRWLVKTVGALVTVIGCVLAVAGWRRATGLETILLAAGSAAGLAGIDVIYVARRRIRPVYLLDAVAEAVFLAGWATAWLQRRDDRARPPRLPGVERV